MQLLKGARVLVTGGTGFVGSHLVRRLVLAQAKVFILARKNSSPWRILDVLKKVKLCRADLANQQQVLKCIKLARPDYIFNVAAMREIDRSISMLNPSININLLGMLNLIQGAEKLNFRPKAFVQTGSLEEYGTGSVPYMESQKEQPVSPYTAGKVAATQFCQMLHRSLKYPIVVLRPCLMYGPGQELDMFIPMLINTCLKNKNFPMTSGEQTRDFGFVSDLVDAYLLAIKSPKAFGQVINIGTGKEYKIKDVAKKIVKISGSKTKLQIGRLPSRVAEIQRLVCNNTKAKKLLGWSPKVSLDLGLKKTIDWYRSNPSS